ncbi:MAG: hypothetical protein SFY80_02465 [Verrucomicrobiota bacterium]|nr:hypothetical protein [Verrucomicrobiota bacterium]
MNKSGAARAIAFQRVDGTPEIVGHLNMRIYFPQELKALLRYTGFEVSEKFGGYEKEPFSTTSSKELIIAKTQRRQTGQQIAVGNPERLLPLRMPRLDARQSNQS